jgi:F420-non-reducing hydrogenase iron-sulfur subunit
MTDDEKSNHEPIVVAFCCEYCSYNAADLAGSMRLDYSTNVRVPCSGRVDPTHVLSAFEKGADAVFVAGCEVGDCHFLEGNLRAKKRMAWVKKLLEEAGVNPERLEFFHVAASAAPEFKKAVDEMTERARKLGPSGLVQRSAEPRNHRGDTP